MYVTQSPEKCGRVAVVCTRRSPDELSGQGNPCELPLVTRQAGFVPSNVCVLISAKVVTNMGLFWCIRLPTAVETFREPFRALSHPSAQLANLLPAASLGDAQLSLVMRYETKRSIFWVVSRCSSRHVEKLVTTASDPNCRSPNDRSCTACAISLWHVGKGASESELHTGPYKMPPLACGHYDGWGDGF